MTVVSEKLINLRKRMNEKSVDFYYVPTRDAHNNEYVPAIWQRRAWLSDFTGSYGEALVGLQNAYLWTDPRYFLQAEKELDSRHFQLMKQLQGVAVPVSAWLSENAANCTVGVDPKLISIAQARQWMGVLSAEHGALTAIPENMIDAIWQNKPSLLFQPVQILSVKYAGLSVIEKLSSVRHLMKQRGADALVISQLDEIAWLFNIRGKDIPFNPLVISYAIVTKHDATLFLNLNSISSSNLSYFSDHNIALLPYEQFASSLSQLTGTAWVDPATTSWWVQLQLDQVFLIEKTSPIVEMKSIKNKTEREGMREAHRLDAIAVVKFLHWLDSHWQAGLDEVSAADQLEKFRRESVYCQDLSFDTICGFADHGAIVHYRAEKETAYRITDQDMLLIDSGGQYFQGTTDITRTIHLGAPTPEQKKHYTLVLKGHLALRHTPFPNGVCGEHVNTIARIPLWQNGMDFGHGTGHGVGCYLCVHEGPQRIAFGATGVPLKPGMMVSNEPGLYFPNRYGIRIENVCEIVERISEDKSETGHGPFYGLADLTMVPYAQNLIDKALLTAQEIQWIDDYHREINLLLAKDLPEDAALWLKAATKPLP